MLSGQRFISLSGSSPAACGARPRVLFTMVQASARVMGASGRKSPPHSLDEADLSRGCDAFRIPG